MSAPMSAAPSVQPTTKSDKCPQCGNWTDWKASSWCTACGYYPALGRIVGSPEDECEQPVYENWWEAIPSWLWVLVTGCCVLILISVTIRVAFAESVLRMWWTLAQLGISAVTFCIAHLLAYMHAASRSDGIGPLDAFLKPIAIWQPVLRSQPSRAKLLWAGTWSLTAAMLAAFVIGGIDYEAMSEASRNADKPNKKPNPMAIVIQSAQKVAEVQNGSPDSGSATESLTNALNEFTGDGSPAGPQGGMSNEPGAGDVADADSTGTDAGNPASAADGPPPPETAQPGISEGEDSLAAPVDSRALIQCVVIGYTTNSEGDPRSLLLAARVRNRLTFVARVSLDRIDQQAIVGIPERLLSLQQRQPITASPFGGRWIRPELFCDVRYAGWTSEGRLRDPYVMRIIAQTPLDSRRFDASLSSP